MRTVKQCNRPLIALPTNRWNMSTYRRAVEAGIIVPMTYNGTVKDADGEWLSCTPAAQASRPSDANVDNASVELHYWPYKN